MNLESQVTNLELSKRLKELNIPQESLFYWECSEDWYGHSSTKKNIITYDKNVYVPSDGYTWYSAFTAAELLAMLPYHILSKEPEPFNSYRLYISGSVIIKNPECIDPVRTHIVNYVADTYGIDALENLLTNRYLTKNLWDENPANALGKMLVYLHETGLLKND